MGFDNIVDDTKPKRLNNGIMLSGMFVNYHLPATHHHMHNLICEYAFLMVSYGKRQMQLI
jgi:hypothetical protein